jgi:hypothetical protein
VGRVPTRWRLMPVGTELVTQVMRAGKLKRSVHASVHIEQGQVAGLPVGARRRWVVRVVPGGGVLPSLAEIVLRDAPGKIIEFRAKTTTDRHATTLVVACRSMSAGRTAATQLPDQRERQEA